MYQGLYSHYGLANAHYKSLQFLEKSKGFNIFNIGTGRGYSVLELINTFMQVNQVNVPYEFVEKRDGDRGIVFADNSLALEVLKWQPKKSIEEMCKDGWNWRYLNPKGYKK